jgi:hypothetical protein
MKSLILSAIILIAGSIYLLANQISFQPCKVVQPDGDTLKLFLSGDEYYHWIHDENGYTVVKGEDNFYYYAIKENDQLIPSRFKALSVVPELVGIEKWLKISTEEYLKRRAILEIPEQPVLKSNKRMSASVQNEIQSSRYNGTFNNIVIYIRFADESEFTDTRDYFDILLNTGPRSMRTYYKEVSYNKLDIVSHHYPLCATPDIINVSYQDSHNRAYFSHSTTGIIFRDIHLTG